MPKEIESSTVAVLESSQCFLADSVSIDTALTILGLISDDPSTWEEAASVWHRYRSPAVCEFPSSLPIELRDRAKILGDLRTAEAWIVIDFASKRILTGGSFPKFGRDVALNMSEDESSERGCAMSIHLPPWWEYQEDASVSSMERPRESPIRKPYVDRDVLYGDPFLMDIASRILAVVSSDAWQPKGIELDRRDLNGFTIAVHRDWLMTPREDLAGRMPRELLHGAIRWSEAVTWGQELRCHSGEPMVAVPDDWDGYATAPMGSQEMCIYFDLCREVIEAGWYWCHAQRGLLAAESDESNHAQLVSFLREVKEEWLASPFEGGSPPNFIIECDRRRVPCGAGIPIQGIEGVQTEAHIPDCDCPICAMMADGMFGPSFTGIDGHHLELDDEFAFSKCETREEWEEQRIAYDGFGDNLDGPDEEIDTEDEDTDANDDSFGSAWTGIKHEGPIPGDRGGYLKMAFMIAEIGMALESHDASLEEIRRLNTAFADYRRSGSECAESAQNLRAILQSISLRYPELIPKSADLQSHIDESARAMASNDRDTDNPF